MDEKNKDKKLIKDFVKGKLSKKQEKAFMKRASTDKILLKDFVIELEKLAEADKSGIVDEDESPDNSKRDLPV